MAKRKTKSKANKKEQTNGNSLQALAAARARYEDHKSCGDEMAKALEIFRTKDGLDVDGLTKCLRDNDCKVPAVDMEKHGATGRFRMVAGLILRAAAKKRPVTIGNQSFGKLSVEKAHQIGEAPTSKKKGRKAKNELATAA